jgi:hypothetical protein
MKKHWLIGSIGPISALIAGLAAFYVAERALHDMTYWVVHVLGALSLLTAGVLAGMRPRLSEGDRRRAYARVFIEYAIVALAVVLYFLMKHDLVPEGKLHATVQVLWPALLLLGLVPAIAMELSLLSMRAAPTVELWRVKLAARGARIVVLAMIAFAGFNFAASKWNRKIDLSYFKTTEVGTATQAIVKNLTKPVRLVLFFPAGNDVLEQVRIYADALAQESDKVTVEVADQALDTELAKTLKVRNNGYIAIVQGEKSETLKLDVDLEDARAALRELDAKMQEKLMRVIRPPRVAYFTTGHMERDYSPLGDDKRFGLGDFKTLTENLGFIVKRLGLGEGLGNKVPDDAALVVIAGAIEGFLAEERSSIQAYLDRGGKLLLLVDPDTGSTEDDLTAMLGVKVGKTLAAHDRYLVRVEGKGESPYYLATNRVSAHPSVTTLSRAGDRYGVVLLGVGAVTKLDKPPADLKITMTLRSMPDTWLDQNENRQFDKATEKRAAYDYAAAIERTLPAPADAKEGDKVEPKVMRAIVVGDADVGGDGIVRNPGNVYFMSDALRWLGGEEENAGTVESEKDVPIVHKKEEDTLLFYGTSFLMPALVLGLGLVVSRRPNGRKQKKEVT